jgi:hypothetical protein
LILKQPIRLIGIPSDEAFGNIVLYNSNQKLICSKFGTISNKRNTITSKPIRRTTGRANV